MDTGFQNLHRHLRIAGLPLVSDSAYQAELETERHREVEETRAEQTRLVRWAIDATNRAQQGA